MKTCNGQAMDWWADKCRDCGHLLAAHRNIDVPGAVPEDFDDGGPVPMDTIEHGECTFCQMAAEQTLALDQAKTALQNAIEEQNTALRKFAGQMKSEAQEFASELQNRAKTYVDEQIAETKRVAKSYIDETAGTLAAADKSDQTVAKEYIDGVNTTIRKDLPVWVNNRIATVVKSTALNQDPRV